MDDELVAALRDPDRKVVEVVAHRLAGGTRTLAHNARSALDDHTVVAFVDDPRVSLESMVAAAGQHFSGAPGTVLWLERLGGERLTELASLDLNALPDGLRILATSDLDAYGWLRRSERDRLMQRNAQVFLGGLEQTESPEHAPYSAVRKRAEFSVVEVYAGRELVDWDGIRTALDPHGADPGFLALVRAVTDWQRVGRPVPLTRDRLFGLYRRYREALRPHGSDGDESVPEVEDFQRALDRARTPAQDHPALITPDDDAREEHFAPHPLLTAIADETRWRLSFLGSSVTSRIALLTNSPMRFDDAREITDPVVRGWPVPAPMWEYVDEAFTGRPRYGIALKAIAALEFPAAHRLIAGSGVEPDAGERLVLGIGLTYAGDFDTARMHLARAMEAEDDDTIAEADLHLKYLKRIKGGVIPMDEPPEDPMRSGREAARRIGGLSVVMSESYGYLNVLAVLEDIARSGDRHEAGNAMIRAGEFWEVYEESVGHAREWYLAAVRTRLDFIAPMAALKLGDLERRRGEAHEAEVWYRRALDCGHPVVVAPARLGIGGARISTGQHEHAFEQLRIAAASNHPTAAPAALLKMAESAHGIGRRSMARDYYEKAAASGHTEFAARAMYGRAVLAMDEEDDEAARNWLVRCVESGRRLHTARALVRLGRLDRKRGDAEASRNWLTRAADTGVAEVAALAAFLLGDLEEEQEDTEKARYWFSKAAKSGDTADAPAAMYRLGLLEKSQGDLDSARAWWRRLLEFEGAEDTELYTKARAELADMDPDS
ncbi:tetratricopeptide repeat protein [Nocardiopsis sp. RSe5-2]|uniref:Tetratricopeptide repeat protein n=1 Tax=Nocardiopsis endophytica TaxID=3018445 RepID=A0ABT4UEY3_9ACTN|nr:tetratricopeptide repeat protein [Nocardiopsis endophytica]MDA2815044.1 tetratricopeptide repeat protein [Nocardiopsis endophytica]